VKQHFNKATSAGLLVALGIIYGDIGTSPLYVLSSIIGKREISRELVYGGISCVFWTLTLQTTFKYILLTLQADSRVKGIFHYLLLCAATEVAVCSCNYRSGNFVS
jgi:KUP system potassium uptake protein